MDMHGHTWIFRTYPCERIQAVVRADSYGYDGNQVATNLKSLVCLVDGLYNWKWHRRLSLYYSECVNALAIRFLQAAACEKMAGLAQEKASAPAWLQEYFFSSQYLSLIKCKRLHVHSRMFSHCIDSQNIHLLPRPYLHIATRRKPMWHVCRKM